MITIRKASDAAPSVVSIPQTRLIELIALFCIVYVAREIAGFSFKTGLMIFLFLGSATLNLLVAGFEGLLASKKSEWKLKKYTWEWFFRDSWTAQSEMINASL